MNELGRIKAQYTPSTWLGGARADGETSNFDLFGSNYTFINFSKYGKMAKILEAAVKSLAISFKTVLLPNEAHVQSI